MLSLIILFLTIVNLLLICKTFKIFQEITDNHDSIITILRDEVIELNKELQALRDDGK